MTVVEKLLRAQEIWESSVGASYPGVGVEFRGHDIFDKCKNANWLSMFYFSATGRELSENAEKFLNGVYSMCFSYPDSRIWNNGIAALAASTRSTAQLGVCAASAASEADFYGGRAVLQSVDFILRAKLMVDSGEDVFEILSQEKNKNEYVYGYGRPIVPEDERVLPTIDLLKELNLFDRPHVQLALKLDEHLKAEGSNFRLNVCGLFAAFCADEEMAPQDAYYILVVCYSVGMIACYVDSLEKSEGHFFPFQCSSINYSGSHNREW